MDAQKTLNSQSSSREAPFDEFTESIGDAAEVSAQLVEMQTELFVLDLKKAGRETLAPTILYAVALASLLGAFPLILLSFSAWLIALWGFSPASAYLLSGIFGVILAILCGGGGTWMFRQKIHLFQRTRNEFKKNLRALAKIFHPVRTAREIEPH